MKPLTPSNPESSTPNPSKRKAVNAIRCVWTRPNQSREEQLALRATVRLPQGALAMRYAKILAKLDGALRRKRNSLEAAITGSSPLQPAAGYPTQEVRAIERDAITLGDNFAMTNDEILGDTLELAASSYDGIGVINALRACAQLELALASATKQCEVSRDVELSRLLKTVRIGLEQSYRRLEQLGNALCEARANSH
jgi:hypothetical protein